MLFINNLIKTTLFIFLFFFAVFRCFYGLESKNNLRKSDEQTYLEVIVQSSQKKDRLPTLSRNNNPYFRKPPLYFLTQIFIGQKFGFSLYSLRFLAAISGLLIIMITFFIGTKYVNYFTGYLASLILLTTKPLFMDKLSTLLETSHNFRSISLDAFQLLFIMLAYLFSLFAIKKNSHLFLMSVFSAIDFLIKGAASLIVFFVSIFYLYFYKKINKIYLINIVFLFLVIVLPWHLYEYKIFGRYFLDQYFGYHIISRIFSTLEGHKESFFYYFLLILNPYFYIWGWLFIVSIFYSIFKKGKKTYFEFSIILISLLTLIAFTLTTTKLSWYIVPIYPFASLLIANVANHIRKEICVRRGRDLNSRSL